MIKKEMGGANEDNPQFVQAMKYALQVLYEKGAAKDVAEQVRAGKDKVESMANIAYEITSTVDERTDGKVPRELIGLLAMAILKEVTDIASAAKVDMSPVDAANAFKMMLLRYLGENGVETSKLQQAMDQVDPAVFTQGA
jgi:hypothetical protein